MSPWEPVVLTGGQVRLEPLAEAHLAQLTRAAAENRTTYDWTRVPGGDSEIREWFESAEHERVAGRRLSFATIDLAAERPVGSTAFLDPQRWRGDPGDGVYDSVEIGATWLAASAQRTFVNTEAKLLMLTHAFEVYGVHRVVLNTDARNERSRAAIARIGATFEGILHGYRIGVEGTPRNTATFAITAPDWPEVRARLAARLDRK